MSETRITLAEETKNLVDKLPPELQQEVHDFARYLLETKAKPKPRRKQSRRLKLDWRGALRDERDRYTSVELQHDTLERWGD